MTTELMPDLPVEEKGLVIKSRSELDSLARQLYATDLNKGFKSPVELMICLQAGMELGFTHVQSLQCMGVVNGKASVHSDGIPALMQASGNCEWEKFWWELDGKEVQEPSYEATGDFPASLTACWQGKRKDQAEPTDVSRYSVADAKLAKLWNQNTWAKHPKRMLKRRARGWGIRDYFADALKGLWIMDEAQDLTAGRGGKSSLNERFRPKQATPPQVDDNVIDAEFEPQEAPQDAALQKAKEKLRDRVRVMLVTKKSQWLDNGATAGEFIIKLAKNHLNKDKLESVDDIAEIHMLIEARRIDWNCGDIFPE